MVHGREVDLLSLVGLGIIVAGLVLVYRRGYPLAQSLVLINLAVFMLSIVSAWGQPSFLSPVQRELGFRPVYLGDWENLFTIFTHMFVHSGMLHVLFNMLFLFLIGVPLEERIGRKAFALCFFIPGLLALLMECLVQGFDSTILILGASGAISGAMGAMLFLYPKDEIPMFLGPIFLPRVPVWISIGAWFAIQVVTVLTSPAGVSSGGVAYAAHITGFVAGMGVAQLLPGAKKGKAQIITDLSELATTEELKELQQRIEGENEPQVRQAWLEHFVSKAVCPVCGAVPRLEGNRIKCACGWEKTVR